MTVTLLGTGTSVGIPIIGCGCRVCTSKDPRDRRLRCSCLIEVGGLSILIDAGPDFREQALREHIGSIDAVLITHHHFDHIAGLDDLRPYFFDNPAPMPVYARDSTARVLRRTHRYMFDAPRYPGAALLELTSVDGPFTIEGRYDQDCTAKVTPIELLHSSLPVYGYRIGAFAYLTDTSTIPEESFEQLHGLDVLVLDALRHAPHHKHFSIDQAVEAARRIGARQTYFIHMTHNVLHAEEEARLPPGIALGSDGLSFTIA